MFCDQVGACFAVREAAVPPLPPPSPCAHLSRSVAQGLAPCERARGEAPARARPRGWLHVHQLAALFDHHLRQHSRVVRSAARSSAGAGRQGRLRHTRWARSRQQPARATSWEVGIRMRLPTTVAPLSGDSGTVRAHIAKSESVSSDRFRITRICCFLWPPRGLHAPRSLAPCRAPWPFFCKPSRTIGSGAEKGTRYGIR